MNIKVLYYDSDKSYYDLAPIVTSIEWSGEIDALHRTAVINLQNTQELLTRHIMPSLGKLVVISYNGTEIIRGYVLTVPIDGTGATSMTVVDANWYLTKNEDMRLFKRKRADQIIREICTNFGIPVGSIANTGYVLPKMSFVDGATLKDIFLQSITETRKRNGRAFAITSTKGKLNLVERSKQVTPWTIEHGITMTGVSLTRTMEGVYTQVKAYGDLEDGRVIGTANNQSLISKYGLMQKVESYSGETPTQSAVNALARERLGELSVIEDEIEVSSALGEVTAISGTSIYVHNQLTTVIGGYYIITDTHTIDSKGHSMTLGLSKTNKLPEMVYSPPKET